MRRCLNHEFPLPRHNNYRDGKSLTRKPQRGPMTWTDTLKNALSGTVKWQTRQWRNFTKSQALASLIINSSRRNLNQLEKCPKFAHKSFLTACTWHGLDDLTFYGRSTSLQDQACDRRLARWISCIHHTSDFRQYCHVGNTAQHCRLGLFQDSDFAGDPEDSGGVLCIFGSRTFVPVCWMCKQQTSVSHSSTESGIISLDAGLR